MVKYGEYIPFLVLFLLAILSFFIVKPLLLSIFIGGILAYISLPFYKKLVRKGVRKTFSSLIVCFTVILILGIPGFFFGKTLITQSYVLFVLVKQKLAIGLFQSCENQFCQLLEQLGNDPALFEYIQQSVSTVANWVVEKGSNILISLPRATVHLFVVFFTMFYFLQDGSHFVQKMGQMLATRDGKYAVVVGRLREIMHGIIYGYFFIAFIQGVIGGIGFLIFGISSPLFWGVVMAFLALLPYFGTGLVWGPAALFLFLDGFFQDSTGLMLKGVGLFIYGAILVSTLDNFLKPKLMSGKAKIHPAVMMLGLFGGVFLFGPLGVLVGPLVLSLTVVLMEVYLKN